MDHRPVHFLNLALKYIDDALAECGDEPPPLCILQALIITGHCQLIEGVRGKAWRSLGICIRLAYELNLHLVDAVSPRDATEVRNAMVYRRGEAPCVVCSMGDGCLCQHHSTVPHWHRSDAD
jgi:hypothetical protein